MRHEEVKLILPQADYYSSYCELVKEFVATGERLIPFCLKYPHEDCEALLKKYTNDRTGVEIPEGFVPHTTFWLVTENEVVGVSNLRHQLTDKLKLEGGHIGYGIRPTFRNRGFGGEILELTIQEARKHGFEQVLLTVDEPNLFSRSIILKRGGVFEGESIVEDLRYNTKNLTKRYWIDI